MDTSLLSGNDWRRDGCADPFCPQREEKGKKIKNGKTQWPNMERHVGAATTTNGPAFSPLGNNNNKWIGVENKTKNWFTDWLDVPIEP